MKNNNEKVASIFRAARKLCGKTQVEVSKHLGVSQSCISKIEAGKLLPSVSEWFVFAQYVGIRPDESYHYGYLDQALPVASQGLYENSIFKIPAKYAQHRHSKVRTSLPFMQYFISHHGKAKWESYLHKERVDPDFFLVYDQQLSPQFVIDLATKMIATGSLKPQNLDGLTKILKEPDMHGRLQQEYQTLSSSRDLVKSLIKGIDRYEKNFSYQLDEQGSKGLVLSVSPNDHMKEINYRNDTLGDFLCRYRKKYLVDFSSYSGDKPVSVSEKECHFHGSEKCVYQIQTA